LDAALVDTSRTATPSKAIKLLQQGADGNAAHGDGA
jgi:hypothetical protein